MIPKCCLLRKKRKQFSTASWFAKFSNSWINNDFRKFGKNSKKNFWKHRLPKTSLNKVITKRTRGECI